jgi:diacylglycerol kinase family enzyme
MHNPTAGDERHSRESLVAILADEGHEVIYQSIKDERWQEAVRENTDVVVVAGGDGTVRKVFKELAGATTPVTLFPVGSANNIARTLGFEHDDAARLARGWVDAERRPYDLGRVELPGGVATFVESTGGGIFAEVLARAKRARDDHDEGDKVDLGLRLLREVAEEARSLRWELELDGVDVSMDLVAIEAMNVRETGPNVLLAPDADPGDGLLDFVFVRDEDRSALVAYIDARLGNRPMGTPRLPTRRGRKLVLRPPDECALRVDDELLAEDPARNGIAAARASVDPARVIVLVPAAV